MTNTDKFRLIERLITHILVRNRNSKTLTKNVRDGMDDIKIMLISHDNGTIGDYELAHSIATVFDRLIEGQKT